MARSDLTHVHRSSRTTTKAPVNQWFDDDSEWEHEYDENETEDVYFTVDLTTHVPDAFVKQNKEAKNGKTFRGNLDSRLRAGSARYADATPEQTASKEVTPATADATEVVETAADENTRARNVVQFVGLHTATPYLVYNNDFFTAYWLTDIGTELWITSPGVIKSVVHRGDVLDILGTSRARLMAMPAKLEPKYDEDETIAEPTHTTTDREAAPEAAEETTDPTSILATITATIPQQLQTDSRLQAQASFMEKFQALKRKKGEHDTMPMYSVKQYEYPADAVEIRARALDELDQENETKRQKMTDQPKLIRQPGVHGSKVVKLGMRGNVRGTKATNPSQFVQDTGSPDADDVVEDAVEEDDRSRDDSPLFEPIAAGETSLRRGPAPRVEKLASMGLGDQIRDKP